jgi:hypothetical protein
MPGLAKGIMLAGIVLFFLGAALFLLGRFPGYEKWPGDFIYRKGSFTFIFPLKTCLVISLLLSLLFILFHRR